MTFRGKKNVYVCRSCHYRMVTIDKDDGTTPFITSCGRDGCDGAAESCLYRVDQTLTPTHEWYRMASADVMKSNRNCREHHRLGGLFLRKIL